MRTKILALVMACVMALGCGVTAFAAEPTTADAKQVDINTAEAEIVEVPVTVISVNSDSDEGVSPANVGDSTGEFAPGNRGTITNCGMNPTFKFWCEGGSASTQVKFNVVTAGGTSYGPYGPVKGDGSNYATKEFYVLQGNGTWTFTVEVTGSTDGLKCYVQQIG